jgi:hypothetical protein
MRDLGKKALLTLLFISSQAHAYQELTQYVNKKYGQDSELYWRTMLISNQFAKEAEEQLSRIAYAFYEAKPNTVMAFSNVDCAVAEGDYMAFCTYVYTHYQREYDDKGHVVGSEKNHTYCAIPMSIDFKFAVNYTYDKIYVPAIKAGKEPKLLDYPPAGDPSKTAMTYLQECLVESLARG